MRAGKKLLQSKQLFSGVSSNISSCFSIEFLKFHILYEEMCGLYFAPLAHGERLPLVEAVAAPTNGNPWRPSRPLRFRFRPFFVFLRTWRFDSRPIRSAPFLRQGS